jgi:hypothetical protein
LGCVDKAREGRGYLVTSLGGISTVRASEVETRGAGHCSVHHCKDQPRTLTSETLNPGSRSPPSHLQRLVVAADALVRRPRLHGRQPPGHGA